MKKSLFSVLCALCAISYAGISPNAWAQSNDADEILPPIVFLVLDTSASMNLFFDKDANQTRLTNAMAEIIGGMKLTTDGKLNRAQSGKPFDMPFPTLQNDGKYTPGIKNIPGDSTTRAASFIPTKKSSNSASLASPSVPPDPVALKTPRSKKPLNSPVAKPKELSYVLHSFGGTEKRIQVLQATSICMLNLMAKYMMTLIIRIVMRMAENWMSTIVIQEIKI